MRSMFISFSFLLITSCSFLSPQKDYDHESFVDRAYLLHSTFGIGGLSRSSEMGHENFRAELSQKFMKNKGEKWIQLLKKMDDDFNFEGRLGRDKDVELSHYPLAVYAYHMHHRASRWAHHNLENPILYASLNFLIQPGVYLLENHLHEERFVYKNKNFDKHSLAHGMAGMQGHVYAWVRWAKPGGADDMGRLSQDRLMAHLKYSAHDLLEKFARPLGQTLQAHWHPELGMYRFDGSDTWELNTLSSLMRGLKSVYETLYMFGNDRDRQMALELATHKSIILERVFRLSKDWGLPSKILFTMGSTEPASKIVKTEQTWNFLNNLGSGFSMMSEDQGMSDYISNGPLQDNAKELGKNIDRWLLHALKIHQDNDLFPSKFSYDKGKIKDRSENVKSLGSFILAASNNYRLGGSFERAQDWDSVSNDVKRNSRSLYELLLTLDEKINTMLKK